MSHAHLEVDEIRSAYPLLADRVRAPTLSFLSASARAQPADAPNKFRKRAKFLFRALTQPRLTRAWLARLVQPDLAPLWLARPRLALKLQRPYLCCAWGAPERFAALVGHYELLPRLLSTAARASIYRDGLGIIDLVVGASGRRLDVRLFYHDRFEKEGDLTLALRDSGTGLVLAALTFCLAHNSGRRLAIVGGLQAGNDPRVRGLIHGAADDLHGMRPKAFVLWVLQQLAGLWHIAEIQAVGDGQHAWRHWRKRREIPASYDDFWRESGGNELPGGGSWKLPLHPQTRPRADLKRSRRRTHELRYAMLESLRPEILEAFAALAPGGTARAALPAGPQAFATAVPTSGPVKARTSPNDQFPMLELGSASAKHS